MQAREWLLELALTRLERVRERALEAQLQGLALARLEWARERALEAQLPERVRELVLE